MKEQLYQFAYQRYDAESDLSGDDLDLLVRAREATAHSYAPYSQFRVGSAARLANGEIITGSNQENASFPAGLCAEGVVLATASSTFPGIAIEALAISYSSDKVSSDHPIAPCGICRQSLQEFRERTKRPIKLIMGGFKGEIIVVDDAAVLLPFSFNF